MTTIHVLPYQEPDKQVTAKHRASNLKEHLEAFLAIHNADGFLEEKFEEDCEIGSVINSIFRSQQLTQTQFDAYLYRFSELMPELNRDQLGRLIARGLGYATEDQMWKFIQKRKLEYIPNARVRLEIFRKNSIKRAESGRVNRIVAFRAAILSKRQVTLDELSMLPDFYQDYFKRFITVEKVNRAEAMTVLSKLRKPVRGGPKAPGIGKDSFMATLDTLYICLGYASTHAASKAQEKYGYIENLRYAEHVKIFGKNKQD